jgi:hypothetical protein
LDHAGPSEKQEQAPACDHPVATTPILSLFIMGTLPRAYPMERPHLSFPRATSRCHSFDDLPAPSRKQSLLLQKNRLHVSLIIAMICDVSKPFS